MLACAGAAAADTDDVPEQTGKAGAIDGDSADSVAVTLDTRNGLTFGDGPNKKLTLPVRFSFPGIELREFAIALPEGADAESGRIDLMFGVAGKLGEVIGVVVDGGGLSISWKAGGGFDVAPKPPEAAGLTEAV